MELEGKTVYVTGQFELGEQEFVRIRAKALGARVSYNDDFFDYLIVGDDPEESVLAKAKEKGATQLGHDEACALLSTPLHNYTARLRESLESIEEMKKYHRVIFKHIGEPASAEALAAAEEKLGAPLDPVLVSFYKLMNGVTIGYRKPFRPELKQEVELADGGGPYPHELFMDAAPNAGELWRCHKGKPPKEAGTLNIPPIEELFSSSWGDYIGMSGQKVRFGKEREVEGSDIFLFDATYAYQPIYLGLDRADGTMSVAVGHDHAAGFGDFPSVQVEFYLEQFVHRTHLSLERRHFGKRQVDTWWRA